MITLRLRRLMLPCLLPAALALAACGSSQPASTGTAGAASSSAARGATSLSATPPASSATTDSTATAGASSSGGAGSSDPGHESALKGCAQDAAGDPARLSLCLAAHHVQIQPNGPLLTCLSTANDRGSVFACLHRYVR